MKMLLTIVHVFSNRLDSHILQTFLRTLRFCVAVAAALRRMTPKHRHPHTKQVVAHPTSFATPRTPGTEHERVGTYESMVEYYIEHFLEGVLKTALQSRGEHGYANIYRSGTARVNLFFCSFGQARGTP